VPGTADLPSPPRHYLAGHLPAFGVNRRSICPRGSREHQVCWELAPVHELIKGRGIEPCGHSDRVAARGQSRALGCRVWRDRWISDEFATKERRGRDAPGGKLPPSWEFPASPGGHGLCSFLARGLSRRQVATRIRRGMGDAPQVVRHPSRGTPRHLGGLFRPVRWTCRSHPAGARARPASQTLRRGRGSRQVHLLRASRARPLRGFARGHCAEDARLAVSRASAQIRPAAVEHISGTLAVHVRRML
jgi:hypothetical protein